MEVRLNPELEKKLNDLAAETGRATDELVQDAMAGYLDALAAVRGMLDSRYDDLKSGRVKTIDEEKPLPACARKANIGATTLNERLRSPPGSVHGPQRHWECRGQY